MHLQARVALLWKKKNRSAANSYRGCRLLAKYLPPPPLSLPLSHRRKKEKLLLHLLARRSASRQVCSGKQANNVRPQRCAADWWRRSGSIHRTPACALASSGASAGRRGDTQSHQVDFPLLSSGRSRGFPPAATANHIEPLLPLKTISCHVMSRRPFRFTTTARVDEMKSHSCRI